jgi:5-methylcytosine-specific restriction endonuclease McrA
MAGHTQPQRRPVTSRAQARVDGVQRYYTGKPCLYGHVTERYVSNGDCLGCHEAISREVARNRHNAWRDANPNKLSAQAARYRAKNKEKIVVASAAYYAANVEKVSARGAKYRAANPGKVKAQHGRDYAANKGRFKANTRNRRARKKAAEGTHTEAQIQVLFGKQRGKCAYHQVCGNDIKKGYHADHIVAIVNGGSNWIRNIQLLCQPCNSRKNARDPVVFAQKIGLLI